MDSRPFDHPVDLTHPPNNKVKGHYGLKVLSNILLSMSIIMFFFQIFIIIIYVVDHLMADQPMTLSTGIWVGFLGVIAAGLGMGAFYPKRVNRCLMVSHFVMNIIVSAFGDTVMIVMTTFKLVALPNMVRYQSKSDNVFESLMWVEFFMWFAACTHFIASIVSCAFMCRHWCQDRQPPVTMVNLPGTSRGHSANGYEQSVIIEQLPGMTNPGTNQETNDGSVGEVGLPTLAMLVSTVEFQDEET